MKRAHAVVAALLVLVAAAGVLTLGRALQHPGALADMRSTVAELRAAADSCRIALDQQHGELLGYNERLTQMRERVRDLEGLHPRGVPADSYRIYMELFDSYNDSAGQWQGRVDELQAELEACRETADAHNAALDSLRALLQQSQR
jgi:predicted  nucleic acid-binding Zn-ribbon protein